jgi:hypothetical protein
MSPSSAGPEQRYASLVKTFLRMPKVTGPSGKADEKKKFGWDALKIDGKIFAMLSEDRLVVKLPRTRVDELVASGDGERFDPGHGRLMKEWLSLDPSSKKEWLPLAKEAMMFVGAKK